MSRTTTYPTPIRWGIIGCGDVTEVKSGPAYQKTKGFELKAVMRRNEAKLKDYALRHGVEKTYTDADALINDPDIDAVYIATPPDSHRHYAVKVAAAGKICCVEKPLAPSYADSLAICDAFAQQEVPLFSAYYRRSLPRFEQIATWLKAGKIGEIRHVNWHLSKQPDALDLSGAPNWRTNPAVAPGGYFDDLASHGLDLLTFLLGDITTVHGISLNQQGLYGAKDAFSACWLHAGGVTGAGSWNFGSSQTEDNVEISGSDGSIRFSVFDEKPVVLNYGKKRKERFIKHPKHVQMPHVENMKKELLDGNFRHPSTGATALHTSWIMDRIMGRV
ncbi:Gfo/Idh/MocA family oxidoreductase [Neolewinella aurantiaca]|uniref:Gfo/Idh/MocA family oxidoreductase n=1 Tax=Neolewinella aurantiaca TaxID=2602767 RepID=A0A5C7FIB7_9BACT|nr:Gfo/Idh/MocA family oxidoreductase [Neolewinella aurantiaca]TXF87057.1 Gfo/Idh/MocA family oxidoreductase [Neolewinella aurantiaca]